MNPPAENQLPPDGAGLRVQGVTFAYGAGVILQDINLLVKEGEFVCLLGPSGCGKTTLLRLLAGLELPTAGELFWRGAAITAPSRERGVVFQDYALFPWLNLWRNVAVALAKVHPEKNKKWVANLAREYLELVGLGAAVKKYPHELSGGMRQRGAIARTLAMETPVWLLDEPFGALDPVNRAKLQDLLLQIWRDAVPRKTVIFVTHDLDEAIYLADRIVMLGAAPGRIIHEQLVPLPRPRRRAEVTRSAAVAVLREQLAERFSQDMLRSLEAAATVTDLAEAI
jgi:NitT/TauT family transport system ATP-binding protein